MLSPDRKHLLGGMLVGDASAYGELLQIAQNKIVLPPAPETLILPAGRRRQAGGRRRRRAARQRADLLVQQRQQGRICSAIREQKLTAIGAVKTLHQGGHDLRLVRSAGDRAAQGRDEGAPASP